MKDKKLEELEKKARKKMQKACWQYRIGLQDGNRPQRQEGRLEIDKVLEESQEHSYNLGKQEGEKEARNKHQKIIDKLIEKKDSSEEDGLFANGELSGYYEARDLILKSLTNTDEKI